MPEGIKTRISGHSFDQTISRLQALLYEKGIDLFCLVDHSGEAQEVGLTMPPTKVLIFGNPKGGTLLMLAAPSTALDLPMKILVAEHPDGHVVLSWNDPAWLQQRHGFPPDLIASLAVIETLVANAAD